MEDRMEQGRVRNVDDFAGGEAFREARNKNKRNKKIITEIYKKRMTGVKLRKTLDSLYNNFSQLIIYKSRSSCINCVPA